MAAATVFAILPFLLMLYFNEINYAVATTAVVCIIGYTVLVWKRVLTDDEANWLRQRIRLPVQQV